MKFYYILIGVVLLLLILTSVPSNLTKESLTVSYYENEFIKKPYSVVEGVKNVSFISLELEATNTDTISLNVYIAAVTPNGTYNKPLVKKSMSPRETYTFSTGLIDIKKFEGTIQEFCVILASDPIETRKGISITKCISLDIKSDSIIIDEKPNPDNTTINPTCVEKWTCTAFNSCFGGIQTRTCTDSSKCGTINDKPLETQSCTVGTCSENWQCSSWSSCITNQQIRTCVDSSNCGTTKNKPSEYQQCNIIPGCTAVWVCSTWGVCDNTQNQYRNCVDSNNCGDLLGRPAIRQACVSLPPSSDGSTLTNAVNGNYRTSGVWIKVPSLGEQIYSYHGYSTYRCLQENVITTTPEGYIICSRPSYSQYSRLYLDDGRGNIYTA